VAPVAVTAELVGEVTDGGNAEVVNVATLE
jgi:hypothetical protein